MSPSDVQQLACQIGPKTVREHLADAEAAGLIKAHPDGTFEVPRLPEGVDPWLRSPLGLGIPCGSQIFFLFRAAYGRAAVPSNCRACYKVKVTPTTLRQLIAVYEIARGTSFIYKCGVDGVPYSRSLYAALFYADGLDHARAIVSHLRGAIDLHPSLGQDVGMAIKRGCTEFEVACGPSDRYTFAPELPEVERWLLSRLRPSPPRPKPTAVDAQKTLTLWIQTAFKHGDDTYLDLTNGRRLYPDVVTYSPAP